MFSRLVREIRRVRLARSGNGDLQIGHCRIGLIGRGGLDGRGPQGYDGDTADDLAIGCPRSREHGLGDRELTTGDAHRIGVGDNTGVELDGSLCRDLLTQVGGSHEDRAGRHLLGTRDSEGRPHCRVVEVGSRGRHGIRVNDEDLVGAVASKLGNGRGTKGCGDHSVCDLAGCGQHLAGRFGKVLSVVAGQNKDGIEFHFITPRM